MAESDVDRAIESGIKFIAGSVFLALVALVGLAVALWAWRTVFY